jgi:hypothetical protein
VRKLTLVLTLAAIAMGLGACSDDDPVKPAEFSVTIQVKDPAGNPVEGLRVGLLNDTPYLPGAAKAAVAIQFLVSERALVRFDIRDIEGNEIRVLMNDTLMVGTHQVMWNGLNFEQEHQPSGRYTAHMTARQLGTNILLFEDSTDMLMSLLDTSRAPQGYTDSVGRLVLKDKKLFPHLYDLPDMVGTDENSLFIGKIVLTPTMRISLGNEAGNQGMRFKEEIVEGTVLDLVWDPMKAAGTIAAEEGKSIIEPAAADMIPPPVFSLGPVYPNPFN